MRTPLVAGNWKMHKTPREASALAGSVAAAVATVRGVEVAVAPPFTALETVARCLEGSAVALAGQNMHWADQGAFTGEVSAAMLLELGCRYVILGHSERRQLFGETDEAVARKAARALASGLAPIVCVGETLPEREEGRAFEVVTSQLRRGLEGVATEPARLAVAYEPVWAIGTGRTASAEQAQQMHAHVRALLAELGGAAFAGGVRILYGGSVKASNARELLGQPDVDGALVGGASLDAEEFASIARSGV